MMDRPNRPRTLKDVAAPQCAADRERLERAEHLMDPTHEVTIIEDQARNGDWRVEYFGRDSAGYVTIFTGPEAAESARLFPGARTEPWVPGDGGVPCAEVQCASYSPKL